MDHSSAAPVPGSAVYQVVDIDDIDLSSTDMRRTAVPAVKTAALVASIARRGVLQPVGLRPLAQPINGRHYQVAFGRRRIACAREAGLAQVPAHVAPWTDAEVEAITKVENMVRAEPHPIDQWCAVSGLVEAGFTVQEAAAELGLDERDARRMALLGRLHPSLLEMCEIEMPTLSQLRDVANAPAKVQAEAVKGKMLVRKGGGQLGVDWWTIAQRCRVQRIAQRHAIFDVAKHADLFTEDLFAQPGDPDAVATDQVARFMELQGAALDARIEAERAAGRRVERAEFRDYSVVVPKGWRVVSTDPRAKAKKTETVFAAIAADGAVVEVLAVNVAAEKAAQRLAEAKQRERQKAAAAAPAPAAVASEDAGGQAGGPDDDAGADDALDDDDAPVGPAAARAPIGPRVTSKALGLMAAAKTRALRERLVTWCRTAETERVLGLMILALCAENVAITPHTARPRSHAADMLAPGGVPLPWTAEAMRAAAGEVLAGMLTISGPDTGWREGSGPAAEWIGAAIGAGDALARFDTPEFLAETPLPVLKELAREVGLVGKMTATTLRPALVGRVPDWRPEAVAFGAPAPQRREREA